jgi:hypothetical protein
MWELLPNDQVERVNVGKHLHPLSKRQSGTLVESGLGMRQVDLEMVHFRYKPESRLLRILAAELRD